MRKAISELSAKKGLTLGILEVIERVPRTSGLVLGKLHKAGLLEDLCTCVFKHKNFSVAARALLILHQGNLFRVDAHRSAFVHKSPIIAAMALVELNKAGLLESGWCTRVLEHNSPYEAATALLNLNKADLLESVWCTRVLEHNSPDKAAKALLELNKADLLESVWCTRVLEHNSPDKASKALLELNKEGLFNSYLVARILKCVGPDGVAMDLIEVKKITELRAGVASSENEKVESLYKVLVTLMHDNIRDFFIALQSNYSDNIRTVTRERIMLVPSFTIMFTISIDPVAFFISRGALIVSVFPLSELQKGELLCRLLANKSTDDIPGFHMALQNGRAKIIATFIRESVKAIAEFHLSESQGAELLRNLLASKRVDGTPGLYMALYNGHAEAISTFIQEVAVVIARISLPKKEKADLLCELLASKAVNGKPGFYMALQNGNSDAISAFIQATALSMTTFCESKEEGAELLYRLFQGMERANTQDFLLALEQGGPEVNKAFTQGVDLLPLSSEQKETLKHPTPG